MVSNNGITTQVISSLVLSLIWIALGCLFLLYLIMNITMRILREIRKKNDMANITRKVVSTPFTKLDACVISELYMVFLSVYIINKGYGNGHQKHCKNKDNH